MNAEYTNLNTAGDEIIHRADRLLDLVDQMDASIERCFEIIDRQEKRTNERLNNDT